MALVASGIVLLVGLVMIVRAFRADRPLRRWPHVTGTISQASRAHLADDGRQWWNVRVTYRLPTGEEVGSWARQIASGDLDRRTGETVDVWYDPRRPQRSRVVLGGATPASPWPTYAFGALFAVVGGAVLAWALQ